MLIYTLEARNEMKRRTKVMIVAAIPLLAYAGAMLARATWEHSYRAELVVHLKQGGALHPARLRGLADDLGTTDLIALQELLAEENALRGDAAPPQPYLNVSYRFLTEITPFWDLPAYCHNRFCIDSLRVPHENTCQGLREYVTSIAKTRGIASNN